MKRRCDTNERDRDLYRAYKNVLKASDGKLSLPEVLERTVRQPAKRFYISQRRAYDLVRDVMRGATDNISDERMRMANDIIERVTPIMQRDPTQHIRRVVGDVIDTPAPEFYIKPTSAHVILHYEKKRQQERFRKNPRQYLRDC